MVIEKGSTMFKPKLLEIRSRGYSWNSFGQDLSAGIIVGVVAIPLAVALAIASGVSPDKGLITAVIAGFIISALGGSRVQIGGPTGAFIVIVYGILETHGFEGLIIATLMAGVFLVFLGVIRMGNLIQFIPYPVILGFTAGIALIIFSSQVNELLGLGLVHVPAEFLEKWHLILSNLGRINPWALVLSGASIGGILLLQGLDKRIPGALVVLVLGTLAVNIFSIPVETIGSRFGQISGAIPAPRIPPGILERISTLWLPALSIALLAGVESLLSAVVADGLTGEEHDSNTELIAQGIANIACALFGGIPATGAIARTATNIRSGAKSPLAGIIHAVFLLGVLLFLSPLASLIPLAVLAGILTLVAYNMSEVHTVAHLMKGPRSEGLVLVLTFGLTVIIDLTVAIPLGMLLAFLVFLRTMSKTTQVRIHRGEMREVPEEQDPHGFTTLIIPEDVDVVELEGPWFFGAVESYKTQLTLPSPPPRVRIIRMRLVSSIDTTGARNLAQLIGHAGDRGTRIILAGAQPGVIHSLESLGITKSLGDDLVPDLPRALERAQWYLGHRHAPLAEKLSRGGVHHGLRAQDPLEVIRQLCARLDLADDTRTDLMKALVEREELGYTAVGRGLAMPHPRWLVVHREEEEFLSLAYLEHPVDYQAPDGQEVTAVFLIVASSPQSYQRLLSRLVRKLRLQDFQDLLAARAGLEEWISALEEHHQD
ncbi:SulP family inorganic anion transporter [Spirochaeta lutea]|uniref:SulP family inorganic anion transporter n=1 Tax=Spirochaeta lutea TaxID=1480694 RepID=UPI0009DE88C4|nr:SulP family inorganic anion transporter [Spirochaeta lutea]